jgi:uncharacterized protein
MTQRMSGATNANPWPAIAWRPWSADTFADAVTRDRPVLLNLTAVWCHWCRLMDETTYADPDLVALISEKLVPVRVDADRYPHVQDRYIAGGWPTNAFLTPTGEVLWSGTYVAPDQFRGVAESVLAAWAERRQELKGQIELRRKAMEAARSRRPAVGIVRREAADDVFALLQEAHDARNGGFGDAPKFPQPDAVLVLMEHGRRSANPDWLGMAERTLDGMLTGELWDAVDGGFFRYALRSDWTEPHHEKLLETQSGLLRAYAAGAVAFRREDFRRISEETVAWVDRHLQRPDGLWGASQEADAEYHALSGEERRARPAPGVDPVLYADRNAGWIQALAEAGGRLGRPDWISRAAAGLAALSRALEPDGVLHHFRLPGQPPELPRLLGDSVAMLRAMTAVAQATGDPAPLARASAHLAVLEQTLWAEQGGFYDRLPSADDFGALRYRERPFELNAALARLLLDVVNATGERRWRGLAERTLAVLSPLADRYGAAAADFAAAVEDFYEPPPRVYVVGEGEPAARLRTAALALPEPGVRVWSLPAGGRVGQLVFDAGKGAAAYACGRSGCSAPITDPAAVAAALTAPH